MGLTRRDIFTLGFGAAAAIPFTPVPWKLLDESAKWSQNWSWIPRPPQGPRSVREHEDKMPSPPPMRPTEHRERTPLEPGEERVRLHRKTRNQHDRRNYYRRRQREQGTGAQEEEHRRCGRRETRKHDPHDERERAQRVFPQIVPERLIVL